ncbi:MAG: ABC transporter ATP-binding protein [Minisyncoccia bacterium]|jgi:oligopeptide/dipeptide ABC transporter ATP-binding protein
MDEIILNVENLKIYFTISSGLFVKKKYYLKAVNDVSFNVYKEEILALVGESGSGKTTIAKGILGIYKITGGRIFFEGENIVNFKNRKILARKIQYLYQDPSSSLDPRKKVLDVLMEPILAHKLYDKIEAKNIISNYLEIVKLPPSNYLNKYIINLSGGEKQRIAIVRLLLLQPKLIILDEPTASLDVSVQAKILELLVEIKNKYKLTYILITHDLSVVKNIANRVIVLYLGKIMEIAETNELFINPLHPYTTMLLSSIPVVNEEELKFIKKRIEVKGEIQKLSQVPTGCPFHPRCPYAMDICKIEEPNLIKINEKHFVSCHLFK